MTREELKQEIAKLNDAKEATTLCRLQGTGERQREKISYMISMKEMCEASREWFKESPYNDNDSARTVYLGGFRGGVMWAQDEVLKKLWHDASEEPEKNKLYDRRKEDRRSCKESCVCRVQ